MCSRICYTYRVEKLFRTFSNLNFDRICGAQRRFSNAAINGREYCAIWSRMTERNSLNNRFLNSSSSSLSNDNVNYKAKELHNPNKFGTLSDEPASDFIGDEGDVAEDKYVSNPVSRSQKLRISEYAAIIKEHLEKKEISAAVDVIETRMAKDDRVKPDSYIYSLVISTCGRYGQAKRAFQLYRKMSHRGLKIPGSVYTALFNACATSSDSKDGLERATKLRSRLIEKGVELNQTHYHAMLKAFGRCGDLSTTFQLVDLMVDKQIDITEETFSFLLHACITDKKSGFRYALLVWHKMLQKNMKPSIFTFNLILRAVRDCGVGEPEEIKTTLQNLLSEGAVPEIDQGTNFEQLIVLPSLELKLQSVSLGRVIPASVEDNFPDLLAQQPRLGTFAASLDLTKPHQRMFLLGGSNGFLQHMKYYKVAPTIKTFTVLLDCIPPTTAAEKILLSKIKKNGLKMETIFCNMLIKRRSFRFDYFGARDVLRIMSEEKLFPDLITFGVLALSCQNLVQGKELIRDMRMMGYGLNEEILGAMLHTACVKHDFKYTMKILYLLKEEDLKFSSFFEENIETLIASSKSVLRDQKDVTGTSLSKSLQFKREFTVFLLKYKAWLNEVSEKSTVSAS